MPVSGLILSLSDHQHMREQALQAIHGHGLITAGALQGRRLPIVVDTPTSEQDREVWEWLSELPGVVFVDLVCTDSSDDASAPTQVSSTGKCPSICREQRQEAAS
ncbi:MAG: hypothetical protein KIT24_12775 [Phycisphaeraceae bacterium]|nr:hypothetical protein [Phycisphaeraceae bacterium]